jgi:DNA-binding NtrC family response regulator
MCQQEHTKRGRAVARFLKSGDCQDAMLENCAEISPHAMNKSAGLRVLVVDDEPLIRWSLAETLSGEGHWVAEASDGESALRTISEAGPFDVVVLDQRLPDSNDLRLLAKIRRVAPGTAVVMMTAFGTPDVFSEAVTLGAYRVVAKPFDVHEMVELVSQAHQRELSGS